MNRESLHREPAPGVTPPPLSNDSRLGRGLGHLLRGIRHPADPNGQATPVLGSNPSVPVNSGLRTLLKGVSAKEEAVAEAQKSTWATKVLPASLVAGDVIILILVGHWIVNASRSLAWWEIGIGALALGVGAWLACLALLFKP